jgi:hypothetical protein
MDPTPASGRIILGAAFGTIVVLAAIVVVILQGRSPGAVHDSAPLPEQIVVCGRQYHGPEQVRTLAEIRARGGLEPALVDPAPLAPCPSGVLVELAGGIVNSTVVYVRVEDDGYVAYELSGGP